MKLGFVWQRRAADACVKDTLSPLAAAWLLGCSYDVTLGDYQALTVDREIPAPNPVNGSMGLLTVDAGAPRCPGDELVCESFDHGLQAYETEQRGAMVSLEQEPVFSGQHSLRLFASGGDTTARVFIPIEPALQSDELFVRFHAFVPATTQVDDWVVVFEWWHVPAGKVSFDLLSDSYALNISGSSQSEGPVFHDRWFCVLLRAEIAQQGEATLNIDGVDLLTVYGDTLPQGGIGELVLSAHVAPDQQTPVELFIDDFTAATSPLACP